MSDGDDGELLPVRNDLFDGLEAYVDTMVDGDDADVGGDEGAILGHPVRAIPRDLTPDDGNPTHTSREQHRIEEMVGPMVREVMDFPSSRKRVELRRDEHLTFLMTAFEGLGTGYSSLDASKPWLCYWITHAVGLLNEPLGARRAKRIVRFLERCQTPSGGFAGGPQQLAHLAPTYATVLCLASVGFETGYQMVDRARLYPWLLSLKRPDGAFAMHHDGEADVRATYCALVVAKCTNLLTPELVAGVDAFVLRCQSYEGGFAGWPGNETHGGYTFCGAAAAAILGILDRVDVDALLQWCARRQMTMEGGYSGRANKLVDSCYSFWVGAVPLIIARHRGEPRIAIDQLALQEYLLICCQNPRHTGGMIDKPGRSPDLYHTCYALSGLSAAQHNPGGGPPTVLGVAENLLLPIDPVLNVVAGRGDAMAQWFRENRP